jgi:heat shock protein HslJ
MAMRISTSVLRLTVIAGVIFAACNAEKKPTQAPAPTTPVTLTGTQWSLEDLAGKAVISNSRATLTFPEVAKVSGNGSCNRFAGSAEIHGSAIKFGPLAATRMMCDPDASNQETQYLKALERVQRFAVKDGKLYLYLSGSDQPLRFHPAN